MAEFLLFRTKEFDEERKETIQQVKRALYINTKV